MKEMCFIIDYPETIICEDPTVLEVREAEDWDPNLEQGDFNPGKTH